MKYAGDEHYDDIIPEFGMTIGNAIATVQDVEAYGPEHPCGYEVYLKLHHAAGLGVPRSSWPQPGRIKQ
jgi:hypothetical protein